jgi:hypothetical protein
VGHRLLGGGERELEHLGDIVEIWGRCGGDVGEIEGRDRGETGEM